MAIDRGAGNRFRVERPADVEAFMARAGDFIAAHEAEHCLLLGIAHNIRHGLMPLPEPPIFAVVADGGSDEVSGGDDAGDGRIDGDGDVRVVAAALRTPPYNLVLSLIDDLDAGAAVDALADALVDEVLPGVSGRRDLAARFAERWGGSAGRRARVQMAERIYRLSAVREPRPAPGRMRPAERADRPLLIAWIEAFFQEALGESTDPADTVDRWLAGEGRTLHVWEDGDVRVSLCGVGGETPNGIRVGPVYTPPEHRGHGYASNLVAGVSRAQLDAGRRFVFLFTDLANPTSNRIYQDVGYEPVVDVDRLVFEG
ncbi:MAG: GNAT family N-acetyltransferase [Chloroflexota bacterium]|nr:MAG: GNAT family N-acetyltransferase [Chloroflexota bacterium]